MKYIIIGCVLLCCFAARAQDTIYKRNGEVVSARILEIGTAELKYKRFTMPEGPIFIIGKGEVQKIRFSNGVVDSFALAETATVTPGPAPAPAYVPGQRNMPVINNLIQSPRPGLYYYNQARINEKKVLLIAMDKNRAWKDKDLTAAVIAAQDFKRNQYISGFGGPVVLLACLFAAGQTSQNNPNGAVSGALAFNGLGIFIASQIISPMFKRKRSQSVRKVIQLYNAHIENP